MLSSFFHSYKLYTTMWLKETNFVNKVGPISGEESKIFIDLLNRRY